MKVINKDNPKYPELLKEIYDSPANIYARGNENILNKSGIAVVGTRKPSPYGEKSVKFLVKELVQKGFVIVSGLALGIDTVAHQTAIENGGLTIAVLGSSIDDESIYPKENIKLADDIIKSGGAVISEYEPPFGAKKHTFPQRNRIVSGLSEATIVIEAPVKSGALITARLALEQNREVFALPGEIFSKNSVGTNNLIKQGAQLITSSKEIIEALGEQRSLLKI